MGRGLMKAAAGFGKGLAVVGEMGLQAELLAKRDEVLNRYRGAEQDKDIASREAMNREDIAARKDLGMMQEAGADRRLDVQEKGADRRLQKQLEVKDNKPTVLSPGAKLIGADGSVLAENNTSEDKPVVVPEGAHLTDARGNLLHSNPKDRSREVADDLRKDFDALRALTKGRMGEGFLEKFSETERQEFDRIFIEGARKIRKGTPLEEAYDASIKEFQRWRATQKVGGKSGASSYSNGGGSKVDEIRKKFQF